MHEKVTTPKLRRPVRRYPSFRGSWMKVLFRRSNTALRPINPPPTPSPTKGKISNEPSQIAYNDKQIHEMNVNQSVLRLLDHNGDL